MQASSSRTVGNALCGVPRHERRTTERPIRMCVPRGGVEQADVASSAITLTASVKPGAIAAVTGICKRFVPVVSTICRLLDEPIVVAGDHGQGRLSAPNDLGLGRVAGLELPAIDQRSNRCGSSSPETVSFNSRAIVLPKRSVPAGTDDVRAAFGQLERLPGRAVGGRGKRMLLDQFLAGCLRRPSACRKTFSEQFLRAGPIGGIGRRYADVERSRPPGTPAGSFPVRSRSRGWRPSLRAARIAIATGRSPRMSGRRKTPVRRWGWRNGPRRGRRSSRWPPAGCPSWYLTFTPAKGRSWGSTARSVPSMISPR